MTTVRLYDNIDGEENDKFTIPDRAAEQLREHVALGGFRRFQFDIIEEGTNEDSDDFEAMIDWLNSWAFFGLSRDQISELFE